MYNNNVVSQIQLTSNAVRIDSRLCVWRSGSVCVWRSGSVFVVGGKRVLMGKKSAWKTLCKSIIIKW